MFPDPPPQKEKKETPCLVLDADGERECSSVQGDTQTESEGHFTFAQECSRVIFMEIFFTKADVLTRVSEPFE